MSIRPALLRGPAPRFVSNEHYLPIILMVVMLLAGFIHTWDGRHFMNPDGISYLDLADALFARRWDEALNLLWSTLYPLLLGLGLLVLIPDPYWEFAVAHLVNFVIYLASLSAFSFFLKQLASYGRTGHAHGGLVGRIPLPDWALQFVGYGLFTWTSLELISLRRVTPDLGVAQEPSPSSSTLTKSPTTRPRSTSRPPETSGSSTGASASPRTTCCSALETNS